MHKNKLEQALRKLESPILIISSQVGAGNVSVGEAIRERLKDRPGIYHLLIEDIELSMAIKDDILRYKFISDNFPFFLNLVYRIPLFYYRKLIRERLSKRNNLSRLKEKISSLEVKTVICVSHRPAFWLSVLKKKENLDFKLYGVLTEFGRNLGWKYIFWDVMDGFFSPLSQDKLGLSLPPTLRFIEIEPPCRTDFYVNHQPKGDKNKVLVMTGYWGQVSFYKVRSVINSIFKEVPDVKVTAVCGTNKKLLKKLSFYFKENSRVVIHGQLNSTLEVMLECASIITKPGFSTIVEAHALGRAIFLLKGMPVAEENNARYSIANFGAQWFKIKKFKQWYFKQS
jgi:UDP-N-acetylglucosamine:LPS N-acetylglucosamine transferase